MKFPFFSKKLQTGQSALLVKKIDIDPLKRWQQILFSVFGIIALVVGVSFLLSHMVNNGILVDQESREKVEALKPLVFKEDKLHSIIDTFYARDLVREPVIGPALNTEEKDVSSPKKIPVASINN